MLPAFWFAVGKTRFRKTTRIGVFMEDLFEFEEGRAGAVLKKYYGQEHAIAVPEYGTGTVGIGRYAFAENRSLEEVFLPDGILVIDRHAFYNCRSLSRVSVPGGLKTVEDGAFKNCEKLSCLEIREAEPGDTCLKHLIYDQNHAVRAEIHYRENGGQCKTARLFFPGFEYEYIANEPARVFHEVGYGVGYLYQQCFFDRDVDYGRYDSVFASACVSEPPEILSEIALLRLTYPYKLSAEAAGRYQSYLSEYLLPVCMMILEKDCMEQLLMLEELGYLKEEILPELMEEARKKRLGKGLAWLFDYQNRKFGRKKQEFYL